MLEFNKPTKYGVIKIIGADEDINRIKASYEERKIQLQEAQNICELTTGELEELYFLENKLGP